MILCYESVILSFIFLFVIEKILLIFAFKGQLSDEKIMIFIVVLDFILLISLKLMLLMLEGTC